MDEVNFERNLHGFILSVLHAACSESEAEALHQTTLKITKEIKETATEAERTDFFRDIRSKELGKLIAKGDIEDMRSEKVGETANEEERAAFFRDTRKEERLAFFQSIKERERKWKEERNNTRMRKRQEKIKMFAEFHTPAVNPTSPVNSRSQEPVNSILAESRDTNEPTKLVQIKISNPKHRDSTIEQSRKSVRFQRFRTWLKSLCCSCSQNDVESQSVSS